MNNEEILKKSIVKAEKNGWKDDQLTMNHDSVVSKGYDIIFDHNFAKAFWGGKDICEDCGEYAEPDTFVDIDKQTYVGASCGCGFDVQNLGIVPEWEYHLTQMVLTEAPMKYIEKFLEVSND